MRAAVVTVRGRDASRGAGECRYPDDLPDGSRPIVPSRCPPAGIDSSARMGESMRLNVGRKFGVHVRSLRHERQLTQEEVAERSELSVDAVRRIERGAFSPSLETVNKLATGLDVSLRTLFNDFDRDRHDHVAELCDYLGKRN